MCFPSLLPLKAARISVGLLAACGLAAALCATPLSAAERLRVDRTDPHRQRTLPYDPDIDPAIAVPRPPPRHVDRIVYSFDRPIRSRLTLSRELSDACRRGEFIQRIDLMYRAFGPGERPLGVAYGIGPVNLVDPKQRRDPKAVYFFADQAAGRCRVYVGQMEQMRPFFIGP
jgi:hypothetical protein